MYAGALQTRVEIYRNNAKQSASGFTPDAWELAFVRHAQVISQKGAKAMNSGSVWYPTARVVKVRQPLKIDESYRLLIDGVWYEIISIDRVSDKQSLTINCEQIHEA